jgi:adenine phosphoribosyltransferase
MNLKPYIRQVSNFPIEGINFQDLSQVFGNPQLMKNITNETIRYFLNKGVQFTKIIGIESRGFMLATLLSQMLDLTFVMIRKSGKLPSKTYSVEFDYEYASAKLEILQDSLKNDDVILIHDDVLASGSTALSIANMITKNFVIKKENIYFSFIVDLDYIQTEDKTKLLNEYKCFSINKLD